MRKPSGYAVSWDRETGKIRKELDTFQCNHCHKHVHIQPFCDPADLGGHCGVCDGMVCKECNYLRSLGRPCVPFMKRLEKLDDRMAHGGTFIDPDRFADG